MQQSSCALHATRSSATLESTWYVWCYNDQELELLRHAASLPEQAMQQPPEPPPADVMAALQRAATALGSTGGAAERERLRAGVFRPSHELPTMSLAQQVCG